MRMVPSNAEDWLTVKQAVAYCGISDTTLRRLRAEGKGPRYTVLTHWVLYRKSDIDEWIESRTVETKDTKL